MENLVEKIEKLLWEKIKLEEENKKLKEKIRFLEQCLDNKEKVNKQLRKDIKWYEKEEDRLREENRKLKEEKDFFYKSAKQFREDAESWRKEAEQLLGIEIFWKTLSERIEDDKKVIRMDTSCMEEDTLQELKDLGKI